MFKIYEMLTKKLVVVTFDMNYILRIMGCVFSLCNNNVQNDLEDQYKTLVVTKPAPIILSPVRQNDDSDTDVPLFQQVSSDSDDRPIENPRSATDEEINLYAESLRKKD